MTKHKPKIEVLIRCDGEDFAKAEIEGRFTKTEICGPDSIWKNRLERSKIFQQVKLFARDQQADFADPKFLD